MRKRTEATWLTEYKKDEMRIHLDSILLFQSHTKPPRSMPSALQYENYITYEFNQMRGINRNKSKNRRYKTWSGVATCEVYSIISTNSKNIRCVLCVKLASLCCITYTMVERTHTQRLYAAAPFHLLDHSAERLSANNRDGLNSALIWKLYTFALVLIGALTFDCYLRIRDFDIFGWECAVHRQTTACSVFY